MSLGAVVGLVNPLYLAATVPAVMMLRWLRQRRRLTTIRSGHQMVTIRRNQLAEARMYTASGDARWELHLRHDGGTTVLGGPHALAALGQLLVHVNRLGGTERDVDFAARKLDFFGGAEKFVDYTMRRYEHVLFLTESQQGLAMEMAVHEERERRALEGELSLLETAWREAEELASIADNLLLPAGIEEALDRLRERVRARTDPD